MLALVGAPARLDFHIPRRHSLGPRHLVDCRYVPRASKRSDRSRQAAAPMQSLREVGGRTTVPETIPQDLPMSAEPPAAKGPFRKWMGSLRSRASRRPPSTHCNWDAMSNCMGSANVGNPQSIEDAGRRRSISETSEGVVSAIHSTTVSQASAGRRPAIRLPFVRPAVRPRTDKSSRPSTSCGRRASEDSTASDWLGALDEAAIARSLQRRHVLEEFISTEENYVGDIRFLSHIFVTFLASLSGLTSKLSASINRNLAELIQLHETILDEMHRIVPHSELSQTNAVSTAPAPVSVREDLESVISHCRGQSLASQACSGQVWQKFKGTCINRADPQVAADVAGVFLKYMNRFFVYYEYGATYEAIMAAIALDEEDENPRLCACYQALEAFSGSLDATNYAGVRSKKSLGLCDILIKPFQRMCKYPLLFKELLKQTPVGDCPASSMLIESTSTRLREATAEINKAAEDNSAPGRLTKTWLLQDRLVYPNGRFDTSSRNRIRSFGQIRLCGVLYACWQTPERVHGQYLICLLYRDVLCLASATAQTGQIYTVEACIGLAGIKLEATDNGRGLQCHTAPFSWKVVFDCDCQLYELMLTACSEKEELEWQTQLRRLAAEPRHTDQSNIPSFLNLDIKSMGSVFGKPGTIARNMSIQRATTVGASSAMAQVVLRDTSTARHLARSPSTTTLNRSTTLLTTNARVSVLAPARQERISLESMLSDVWSREHLPFPGLSSTSAATVMRKLSITSLSGSVTKRSTSMSLGAHFKTQSSDELSLPSPTMTGKQLSGALGDKVQPGEDTIGTNTDAQHDEQEPVESKAGSSRAEKLPDGPLFAAHVDGQSTIRRHKTMAARVAADSSQGGASRSSSSQYPVRHRIPAQATTVRSERDTQSGLISDLERGLERLGRSFSLRREDREHGLRGLFR